MKATLIKTLKWAAIVALIASDFLHSTSAYFIFFQMVVAAAALIVFSQAASMRQYVWAALFLVVACFFNPVLPVPYSTYIFGTATTLAGLLFFFSLELMKPKYSIAARTADGS